MAHSPIPRVRAAAGRLGSTCSKAPLAERYISGKDMVTAAMTVADQEKGDFDTEIVDKKLSDGPLDAEQIQQKKSGYRWRQNQGKGQNPVQHRF